MGWATIPWVLGPIWLGYITPYTHPNPTHPPTPIPTQPHPTCQAVAQVCHHARRGGQRPGQLGARRQPPTAPQQLRRTQPQPAGGACEVGGGGGGADGGQRDGVRHKHGQAQGAGRCDACVRVCPCLRVFVWFRVVCFSVVFASAGPRAHAHVSHEQTHACVPVSSDTPTARRSAPTSRQPSGGCRR